MTSEMTSSQARLPAAAVVLAGGTGTRIGLDIPKQLLKIAGKTILEHTLDAFEFHPDIDEIVVVMAPGHLTAAELLIQRSGYRKVTRVLGRGQGCLRVPCNSGSIRHTLRRP